MLTTELRLLAELIESELDVAAAERPYTLRLRDTLRLFAGAAAQLAVELEHEAAIAASWAEDRSRRLDRHGVQTGPI